MGENDTKERPQKSSQEVRQDALELDEQALRSLSRQRYADYLETAATQADLSVIIDNLQVVADRFATDIAASAETGDQETARKIGWWTHHFLFAASEEGCDIDPGLVDQFYSYIHHPNQEVRYQALLCLDDLLGLCTDPETPTSIPQRFKKDLAEELCHPAFLQDDRTDQARLTAAHEMGIKYEPARAEEFEDYFLGILKTADAQQIKCILVFFANLSSLADVLNITRARAAIDPEIRAKFDSFLQLGFVSKEARVYTDLRAIYKEIPFEEYEPNKELLNFELELLRRELPRQGVILDIGCGTGRHLIPLLQEGRSVEGFDLTPDNIQKIEAAHPPAKGKVKVASWESFPYVAHSFEAAYCLGRSFTHNATLSEAKRFILNLQLVLADGGWVIIDTPDTEHGFYAKEIDRVQEIARKLGIRTRTSDTPIIDSPDQKRYFPRLPLHQTTFEAIATFFTQFQMTKIATHAYHDENGEENVNVYWKLTKSLSPLPS